MIFRLQKFPHQPALTYLEGPQSGSPLLFLHGVGRFSEDFSKLAEALASRWHVHALDFRGHGDSDRADRNYLVLDYVRDTVAFITGRFTEPIALYGHSLGAMVALAVAADLPGRVRAVILEEPPFHTMGRWIAQSPWQPLFMGMREIARQGGSLETIADTLAGLCVPTPDGKHLMTLGELRSTESLEFTAKCLSKLDPEVFTPIIEGRWLDNYDEGKLYARVQCPVLLLQGDAKAGAALTSSDAQAAVSSLPKCDLVSFPGAGHLIHWERPSEVLHAIEEFTATLEPPRTTSSSLSSSGRTAWAVQPASSQSSTSQSEQHP